MILILTAPYDTHADLVERMLRERGADVVRFNPSAFPSEASLSMTCARSGRVRTTLTVAGRAIELQALSAMWYRRPETPVPHDDLADLAMRAYVADECLEFTSDVWNSLECPCLPAPLAVVRRAGHKASQLAVAGALGFELPPTLITNDPDAFLDFYRRHNGEVISKLASTNFVHRFGNDFARYTDIIPKRDLGYVQDVRLCPMIFQAYVPKRVELRVTVVGERVFAAEIHSQASRRTRHDWRHYDMYQTPHYAHDLPADVAGRCLALATRLGLRYGAIDLVLTPDGRYVFLEINPNGQFLWIEQATGLPISDAVCDLLAGPVAIPNVPTSEVCHV
jgi:hypothetical protein